MYPTTHLLLGIIFSLAVYLIVPSVGFSGFLVILFSSVLIDVDHYIYYIFYKKDFNLLRAVRWFQKNLSSVLKLPEKERRKVYLGIYFLHGMDIILILFFLSFLNKIFLFIAIGFLFHQFVDFIEIVYLNVSYDKVLSFFYSVIKAKYKKQVQEYKSDARRQRN